VHNKIVRQPGPGMSSRAMHDINVIGSLQLLAACERARSIEAIVIRGSAGIYGAEAHAPQFLSEEMTRLFPLRTRFQRDVAEIENYFETFSRRRPHVICTMLRYQPAIGPSLDTQITRYLSQPACPTYLGFDPRIQLVHEDDALEALLKAIANPVRGAVNVAGRGTIGLGRMIRMAGRPPLPLAGPLFAPVTGAATRFGLDAYSDDFRRLLRYGRAVDVRRLEQDVGHTPRHSTVDAVEDWVARRGSEARVA
jgi:UDP-glucose 4-epimerase